MLFFISIPGSGYTTKEYLNTSHVILYPGPGSSRIDFEEYLNTSHVILYPLLNG